MRNAKHDAILTLLRRGEKVKTIAALFGVCLNTVYRIAKKHKINTRSYPYNREQLIEDVLSGKYATYEEAARTVGLTRQAIYAMVKGAKNERG